MQEPSKTNQELLEENALLKQKIQELEKSEAEHKRSEGKLRESEDGFRSLSEFLPETVFETDLQGTLTFVNRNAFHRFGYTTQDFANGINIHNLIHPDDLGRAMENIQKIMCGEDIGLNEYKLRRKDGSIFPSMSHSSAILSNNEPVGLRGFIIDMTERKHVEDALNESRLYYEYLINSTNDPLHVVDDKLTIVFANNQFKKWSYAIGITNDIVGKRVNEVFTFLSAKVCEEYCKVFSTGESLTSSEISEVGGVKYYTETTKAPVLRPDGTVRHVITVVRDITGNKQAEEALQESEERYKNFVEKSFAGVYVVQNGHFMFLNKNAASFAGYKPEELVGRPSDSIVHPEDRGKTIEKAKKMFRGEDSSPYEFRIVTKEGQTRWIMETVTSIQYNGRRAILGNSMDITERKWAEEALQASQELEKSIILSVPHALFGVEQRRIFFANNAMEDVFGWKPEELIGKSTRVIFRTEKEWKEYGAMLYSRLERQAVFVFESDIPFMRKDGREIFCRMSVSRSGEELGERRRIVATFEDITNRKRAEDALRQSELTLRSVFLAAPVGICIMKNRLYQRANAFWCENFGYPEERIIGTDTRTLYENDEEYDRVGKELYTQLQQRGVASVDTRLRRSDGVFRDVILTAALLRADDPMAERVIIIQDVTERKRAENELKESQRRLSDIIEFLPDATFVIDRDEKVIAWNRAIETVTGIKKEDMLGKGNYEYSIPFYGDRRPILIDLALHPDKAKEKQYTAIQRVGDILFGESFTPNLPPGDIHLSATASVLRDSKGEIIAAIECIRDNTERKRLEERLNRSEKMEGLGRLAGGVAHDLNNVLGVLVGYSELLAEKLSEDNPLRKYAINIQQSSLRGAAIIQDLLTLARRGVTVSEVVDLNKVIFDYLRTPEFEALKSHHPNVKVWTELEEGLLNIKGSPVHLSKTIMNLVSNAAEAISDQGDVTIRSENRYLDRPIRGFDDLQEGDYVVLTISDSGRGISSQDIGKIFEPFYTKKVMGRSGTGLGLAVVWGTVKDHNGYIDVQSEEGKGTIFTLYFPITRDKLTKTKEASPQSMYMGRGESILVVDDVKEQRELAVNMLGRLGYQVEAISSGEEAIAYLNNKVDLVVLDMIMDPGMDGLETYMRILEINPKQKAIIVSGFSETDRVREAQEIGAGSFVRKPYVLEKIGLAVRNELDKK